MAFILPCLSLHWWQRRRPPWVLIVAMVFAFVPASVGQTYKFVSIPTAKHGFGVNPMGGVVRDSQGNLFGTTSAAGFGSGDGTVFEITRTGQGKVLHTFGAEGDGYRPYSGLTLDAAGNLFGTTYVGGNDGGGTVYEIDATGNERVVHAFQGPPGDGSLPYAGVILDQNGNLYGTTSGGGTFNLGTVYKIDTAGNETILHSFQGGLDGSNPFGELLRDATGNLYGTTAGDGLSYWGTVFKIDTQGSETVLYQFQGGRDGADPVGIVQDSDGNFYGATYEGGDPTCPDGPRGCGTVFKLDTAGNETVLYRFTGDSDGAFPLAGVIVDGVGSVYGTANTGGKVPCTAEFSRGCGTIYKLNRSGKLTVLHTFDWNDGASPMSNLTLGPGHSVYGTAEAGGRGDCSFPEKNYGCGVVFQLEP